jgi:hypothetical protein
VFSSNGVPSAVRRPSSFAQGRPESANAKAGKDSLDLVDDPRLVSDQVPPLAVRPLCVFLLGRRDRRHAAMALLAAQPAEKGAHQQFPVEAFGLRPPAGLRGSLGRSDGCFPAVTMSVRWYPTYCTPLAVQPARRLA